MSTWLPAGVAVAALVLLVVVAALARRQAATREARRVEALGMLAERLRTSIREIRPPNVPPPVPSPAPAGDAPLIADRLPGRAAFLDATAAAIAGAGPGTRLTVALARATGETTADDLVAAVGEATGGGAAFVVGPSSVAFLLPGAGRAEGLGALARIETLAACEGKAVERRDGEDAVELVARLLEPDARESDG